jgi:hypothetical protein
MPIWVHLILTILCSIVGAFGGVIIGAGAAWLVIVGLHWLGLGGNVVSLLVGAPLFIGGTLLGVNLGAAFAVYCLPARCPNCGGRTYYRPGRPITYHCRSCRHVHDTGVGGGAGSWFVRR